MRGAVCPPALGAGGQQVHGPGAYPSRRARNLWASASRTRLRCRPHRLPLQMPSSTMAPTSVLVAVSTGMTVSLFRAPLLVSIHDNSRGGAQCRIGNVLRDRELRFPADVWGLPSVIRRKTQSSRGKYVLDGARGRRRLRDESDQAPIKQRTGQWLSHGGRPPSALFRRETPRPSPHETPPRTRVRPPREAPGR